jgi:hypothetical protein
MNKFHAQETISIQREEESPTLELMLEANVRNEKTSDTEKILTNKLISDVIDIGYSYEPKTHSKITIEDIKRINREIIRKIPPEQVESLFNEHSLLVKKKFKVGISKNEEKRLTLIRWELDRIEDAFHGDNIDRFESFLEGYEKFAKDINEFVDNIRHSHKNRGNKR